MHLAYPNTVPAALPTIRGNQVAMVKKTEPEGMEPDYLALVSLQQSKIRETMFQTRLALPICFHQLFPYHFPFCSWALPPLRRL